MDFVFFQVSDKSPKFMNILAIFGCQTQTLNGGNPYPKVHLEPLTPGISFVRMRNGQLDFPSP